MKKKVGFWVSTAFLYTALILPLMVMFAFSKPALAQDKTPLKIMVHLTIWLAGIEKEKSFMAIITDNDLRIKNSLSCSYNDDNGDVYQIFLGRNSGLYKDAFNLAQYNAKGFLASNLRGQLPSLIDGEDVGIISSNIFSYHPYRVSILAFRNENDSVVNYYKSRPDTKELPCEFGLWP